MAKTQIRGEAVSDKSIKYNDIDLSTTPAKLSVASTDSFPLIDFSDSTNLKQVTIANVEVYFNTKYHAKLLYTPEDSANKENLTLSASTTKYPTLNLLTNELAKKADKTTYGYAPLGSDSKIAAIYLPSYVDDVIEGTLATFPALGETSKIYVDTVTNLTYRWGGSAYTMVGGTGLALGISSSTAFRGDYGNTAYLYSQIGHLPLAGGTITGPVIFSVLTASQNLELDASKNVISVAKLTAFNKNYGVTTTDVKVNGTQSVGVLDQLARIDHVHPIDTTRQIAGSYSLTSHTHTGTPTVGTTAGQIPYWNGTAYVPASPGKLSYTEVGGVATLTLGTVLIDGVDLAIFIDGSTIGAQFYGVTSLRSAFARQSGGGTLNLLRPDFHGIESASGYQATFGRSTYITDLVLGDGTNANNPYVRLPNYGAGILKTDATGVIVLDTTAYYSVTNPPPSGTVVNNGTLTLAVSTYLTGSATFTANQAGASTFTIATNATAAATGSTLVARDINGDFTARWINASYFNGTASAENTGAANYIYDSGDGYFRKKTLANVKTEIVTSAAVNTALGTTYFIQNQISAAQTGNLWVSGTVKSALHLTAPNGTSFVYNMVDATATYAGVYSFQAGAGSPGYGGGMELYGHSHATQPGWVTVGISANSGGKFAVKSSANGSGINLFTVAQNGLINMSTYSSINASTGTAVAALGVDSSGNLLTIAVGGGGAYIPLTGGELTNSGTSHTFLEFKNTGGDFYIGRESSVAGSFFPGSSAYANVLYSSSSYQLIVGAVKILDVSSVGAEVTGIIWGSRINLGGTGNTDATIHVKSALGGFGRLTQLMPSAAASVDAINLIASCDASSAAQWWTWGVRASGNYELSASSNFGQPGMSLTRTGAVKFNKDIVSEGGQGRFKGWDNGGNSGQAAEIGLSSGRVYIYNYNRTTAGESGDVQIGGAIAGGLVIKGTTGEAIFGANVAFGSTAGKCQMLYNATESSIDFVIN